MKQVSRFLSGFVIGVVGVALCANELHTNLFAKDPPPPISVDSTPINRSTSGITSFAPIVKKAAPSVVNIYSTHMVHSRQYSPFMNDPFFRQFFGEPGQDGGGRMRPEEVLGSGVIISPDGYILTANHVVNGSEEVKIATTGNKKEYTARIVGSDPDTDVALLKIDATGLPAITLGDSDQLEVGDIVLAIGNPFDISQPGETPTVTMGIVSALGRSGLGFNNQENFIQTDAAINPGNSGGALVDAEGRLIGINTAIESSSQGSEGIGFAVPINLARHVVERLINGGKVTRGYLGVSPEDITPGLAQGFNLSSDSGALIGDVIPGSPAEKAGMQSGDVIVEFNAQKIASANDLLLAVGNCSPGDEATVKFMRDGNEKTIKVTLAQRPGMGGISKNSSSSAGTDALDGVTVDNLDSDARQQLQVPDDVHGAIVTDVQEGSHAAQAGLEKLDIIVEIDHHPVTSSDTAINLTNEAKGNYILLKIWRRDPETNMSGTRFISVDNIKDTGSSQDNNPDNSKNQQ
jgi:serine protease Do